MSNRKRGRKEQDRGNSEFKNVLSDIRKVSMLKEISTKDYADEGGFAEIVAKASENLKTSQLRKFFASIRKMQLKENWNEIEPDFYLLKPKLAVSKGRKLIPREFHDFMLITMSKVDVGNEEEKLENFQVFVNFLESVVAYHKYHNPNA